jgi:small-conductance mechanosensitive channel
MELVMKPRHWFTIAGLFLLIVLAFAGLIMTHDSGKPVTRRAFRRLVDQKPLETARSLATQASDTDEQRFAQQVLRLADHEVDLAFNVAMREAKEHPPQPTPETKELFTRLSRSQAQVTSDQQMIDDLKKEQSTLKGPKADAVQQQIDLVQAQLELDMDELQDAQGDLIRSGADPLSVLQRQFARYQASQKDFEAARTQALAKIQPPVPEPDNLFAQLTAWYGLRTKAAVLGQARAESGSTAAVLQQQHDAIESKEQTNGSSSAGNSDESVITSLKRMSSKQTNLADLDKRIQDEQELSDVYGNWLALVQWHQRMAVHGMILSGLFILVIVLVAYLLSRLVDRYFGDVTADRKRLRTLRMIVRFAVQAIAVLLVFLVVIGTPSQMPTIIGLAGAGLTVALKDFIVAFFGWFALMGRNGLRVGDWVEINGVVGEVVEVGLLRTVLLETGNWTDAGHPTGRKVAFVNSFAIEGHYFNFSTSGQWLWDELQITVPSSQDPYTVIDAIHKIVDKDTEANARLAEQEWKNAVTRQRIPSVSAAPAINLRPTGSGVEVHVRYITRANERYATRTRLYQEIVRAMHGRGETVEPIPPRDAGAVDAVPERSNL